MKQSVTSAALPPADDSYTILQTKWSVVWRAGHGTERSKRKALEEICRTYWMPIYAFVRQRGASVQDAEDLTQGFFCQLLERKWFAQADSSRGKLRNYLFRSLGNFLVSAHDHAFAEKRAGNFLHIEFSEAENGYQSVLADNLSPDRVFQRRWALDAVENALEATRMSYLELGPNPLMEALFPRLREPDSDGASSVTIAAELGITEEKVRQTLCRMRKRFGEELFREVGQTIASQDPEEIRAELRTLLNFL